MVSKGSTVVEKQNQSPQRGFCQSLPDLPHRRTAPLGHGGHCSTELKDTSREAHVANSESPNLFEKITWPLTRTQPQGKAVIIRSHIWNSWWLCFSLNINKAAPSLSIH